MKRKRFAEEQIIGILKEAEAGAKSMDLCGRHCISEQTFYAGRTSTAAWRCLRPAGCGSSRMKTDGSSGSSPI
jgi:putative transposase